MESKFDNVFGSKHVKKVEDVLLFARSKANGRRVTLPEYMSIMTEMYEGAPNPDALAAQLKYVPTYTRAYLDANNTLDVNHILGAVTLLYSRYGTAEKARLLFTAFDSDGNGYISRDEMKAAFAPFFANFYSLLEELVLNPSRYPTIKLGGDYTVYLPGLKRVFDPAKIPSLVDKAFAAADTDGDDRISRDEWLAWTSKEGALTHEWGSIGVILSRASK